MLKRLEETDEGRDMLNRAQERANQYLQDRGPGTETKDEDTHKEDAQSQGSRDMKDAAERFDIAIDSPSKNVDDENMGEDLEEGPTIITESRHASPVRGEMH